MTEQKNLTLTGGQVAVTRPSEMFSPALWRLATTDCDPNERKAKIAAIAGSEGLRAEAARLLPALRQMLDGRASSAELEAALAPLLLVKRKPDFGPGVNVAKMQAAWQAIYYDQLRRFPISAVKAAVKDLLANHPYPDMPQPAELVKAAEPYAGKLWTAHHRLKEALKRDVREVTPVDKAANRKALEEAGWLNPDGTVSAAKILAGVKRPPAPQRSGETPQQMADRLRKQAGGGR